MSKPQFLYHASPANDIDTLKPREESRPDDWDKGAVIFASPSISYASFFLVPTNDTWATCGNIGGVFYMVIGDENKFRKLDKGGTIYTVPSNTFEEYKGFEWSSKSKIKPRKKIFVESGLDYMIENGVQVYFVEEEMFEKIKLAKDCGAKIMNSLTSENQKRKLSTKRLNIHSKG